ncbi:MULTISPECIES: sodium-dependent bicarbonate transport family permease [Mycobacterium]|uniref:Sodium-dependent bicarbonate transport family permease n=2 Tax=Mycobacterium ulcerans group TaxID=2993898 RepID=A0A9N7LTU4_9MYCO|nr:MULTISPECIES: sodium-dependent bicarbonate transport family permease [Mycobacterium]ULL12868.1 sodium-dependent bicarbonate transport family permease [Mycobacterium liflandii]AGC63568.1 conserved membrane permease [Mycobacterium liflandii 128FXT]EPQ46739.1 putative sodium-dependent bicarbonate transporter [Mycobacterium sp. 012931]MBC9861939.1 putative sodium-dependent bicarbonate transporter [Mycobacterium pseudoshottsii]BBA89176.1 sodium-dependent bicarbonate transport family permease [My
MLHEFWENFTHNLFKPLLLFFYFGFLIPILKVRFEFPYVIYQGLTMYLLLAIGWHGGEELAKIKPSSIGSIVGFMGVGFVLNFLIGGLAYLLLSRMSRMRRVDRATVAGYYGSDSAGTFATCVAVLTSVGIAFNAYMPVMLAVMEIPGCLVALYLVARLRHRGMDEAGYMPDEPGYTPPAKVSVGPGTAARPARGESLESTHDREIEQELEFSLEKREHTDQDEPAKGSGQPSLFSRELFQEVFLNPGLALLLGGIIIGLISGLQGEKVVHDDDTFFVTAFQGVLALFLLEMGMTASRKLKDLKTAGRGFIFFGLLAPNLFATIGIIVAHSYAYLTNSDFKPGTYVLFAVLCGAASYIAVPAVQRLAIPEASPTLPLAASLGLTFSYNVTIGIPLYIEIARMVGIWFHTTG